MNKVKITVVKVSDYREIHGDMDIGCSADIAPQCGKFVDGQEFMTDMQIHLGKRSMGWKFCWNFNNNKYYSNKEELLKFIRSGRVVDEYGNLQDNEEFIKMALEWGAEDGLIVDEEYMKNNEFYRFLNKEEYYDKIIDGLRVSSSTDFS